MDCQRAFDNLKTALKRAQVLPLPKDEGTYVLELDAFDSGAVPVLSRRSDEGKTMLPLASAGSFVGGGAVFFSEKQYDVLA